MGYPLVYVLLLLVGEYSCFNYWFSRIRSGEKSEQRNRERVARVKKMSKEEDARKLLVSHSLMVIY